ncbi:MAG: hypothetical protein B7Z37_00585 [Verrucomicrobia bacterium 12-59-8]|nr:MAG: hypothetical protein B7Z37_00585 [Verrucomicrobia bacterium 12-59-8]
MKRFLALATMIVLGSCTSMMNSHRMKAAERKMLETRRLQQAGEWDAALAMAERMHSSIAKSITSAPIQKSSGGTTVDLLTLLTGWENGPFAALKTTLQKHDSKGSPAAFASLRQQCVNCHTVLGKSQIQLSEIP